MKNFQLPQIKSKKDWVIAFLLAFLLIYLVVLRYQVRINDSLLWVTPDKISYFNQPENHGVYAVTVLILMVLSIGIMIYKKAGKKQTWLAMAAGIAVIAVIAGSYFYQCHLILKIPYGNDPSDVSLVNFENGGSEDYELDEKTKRRLADKILALEPISGEEEKRLKSLASGDESGKDSGEVWVSVWYPRTGGHSYHIWVIIEGEMIRINKGHRVEQDAIYRDNGLLQLVEEIKNPA